jgi:hypothetical protein
VRGLLEGVIMAVALLTALLAVYCLFVFVLAGFDPARFIEIITHR